MLKYNLSNVVFENVKHELIALCRLENADSRVIKRVFILLQKVVGIITHLNEK